MSSRALRNAAAVMLVSLLTALSAAPAQALGRFERRGYDSPVRTQPAQGILALLFRLISKAGGAMDPNGHH